MPNQITSSMAFVIQLQLNISGRQKCPFLMGSGRGCSSLEDPVLRMLRNLWIHPGHLQAVLGKMVACSAGEMPPLSADHTELGRQQLPKFIFFMSYLKAESVRARCFLKIKFQITYWSHSHTTVNIWLYITSELGTHNLFHSSKLQLGSQEQTLALPCGFLGTKQITEMFLDIMLGQESLFIAPTCIAARA